jgi:DNA polymerase-3 subunit delta'
LFLAPGDGGAIKIDAVREVLDRTAYRPFEGHRRVVIIDEADALVVPAQNALLKTLEEPPPSSVFILVTARPDALLATVRSRCPVLRFLPLEPEDVGTVLARHGRSEKDARAIAAGANGSVAQALEVKDSDVAAAREVAARVLSHAASTDEPRRRIDAAKDLLVRTGGGGAGDREQLASHLRAMASLLRDVELLATRADPKGLANADLRGVLDRLSPFHGERGVRAFSAIDKALVALEANAGVKVVADWVVLNL